MSSLDILNSKYKPYRITKKGNVTIVESVNGKFVIKNENKDLFTLFNYLENRSFNNFPELVFNFEEKENVFEYLEDENIPNNQKLLDLASLMSSLHNKTVYFKNTSIDDYKQIKDDIDNNIEYLKMSFDGFFKNALLKEYQSPSQYLFCRNYYKYVQCLIFCQDEVNNWYEIASKNKKERVSVVNKNIELDHFITTSKKNYLLSWDNYAFDTPVIDFVNLYKKEYLNYDFSEFLNKYFNSFELLEHEKILLFILISLPDIFELTDNEMDNIRIVRENIDYLYKTEELIGIYYTKESEE